MKHKIILCFIISLLSISIACKRDYTTDDVIYIDYVTATPEK